MNNSARAFRYSVYELCRSPRSLLAEFPPVLVLKVPDHGIMTFIDDDWLPEKMPYSSGPLSLTINTGRTSIADALSAGHSVHRIVKLYMKMATDTGRMDAQLDFGESGHPPTVGAMLSKMQEALVWAFELDSLNEALDGRSAEFNYELLKVQEEVRAMTSGRCTDKVIGTMQLRVKGWESCVVNIAFDGQGGVALGGSGDVVNMGLMTSVDVYDSEGEEWQRCDPEGDLLRLVEKVLGGAVVGQRVRRETFGEMMWTMQ